MDQENNNNNWLVFFGKGEWDFGLEQLLGSDAEVLEKGTFGRTYKANLEKDVTLVVKRLRGPFAFGREKIEEIGGMVHENLLSLKAYYHGQDERLLIYDYMPRGSLYDFLHDKEGSKHIALTWQVRHRIAYGVVRGLEYLHSQGPHVCHGNISSSNILLTDSFYACLSEFGIAQLVSFDSKLNSIACSYQAPELTNGHKASKEADVYSYGVPLLELLTGKSPKHALSFNKGEDLPKWVHVMFREKPIIDVFDRKLHRNQNIEEQMFQILQLAICCTFEYPNNRPTIGIVANRIRDICLSF